MSEPDKSKTPAEKVSWGWHLASDAGVWRYCPVPLRPCLAAVPWVTVCLLLVMAVVAANRFVSSPGMRCELPVGEMQEDEVPSLVALMMRIKDGSSDKVETLVYFDDARFMLSDKESCRSLGNTMAKRIFENAASKGTVLLLVDCDVPSGETVKFAELARASGAKRIQIAEKKAK